LHLASASMMSLGKSTYAADQRQLKFPAGDNYFSLSGVS
jgi:hypothetical protein